VDAFELVFAHADSGIADLELNPSIALRLVDQCRHYHNLTSLSELDGIPHKIQKCLANSSRITVQLPGDVRIDISHYRSLLFMRFEGQHFHQALDHGGGSEINIVQQQLACFDFGEIKDGVDDRKQVLGLIQYNLPEFPLLLV